MRLSGGGRGGGAGRRRCTKSSLAALAVLIGAALVVAEPPPPLRPIEELKALSLDELFEIEVTSVSKKAERLATTSAAISVITAEDIRRSGARSLPELLRSVPGVEVARVDSRQYAVTVRGFNSTTANKLLVLVDGRSIYTPLYSGVFWDAQDLLLDDIERIEVIRGPGAATWGANAVNGVINIIRKPARDTAGLRIEGGGGVGERGFGSGRWGTTIGEGWDLRVFGQAFERDESSRSDGSGAGDRFRMQQGGFRLDREAGDRDRWTFQADLYSGVTSQAVGDDIEFRGQNVLGRWTRTLGVASELEVQVYFDRTHREMPLVFGETLETWDVALRNRFPVGRRHDLVWGIGYRRTDDSVENSSVLAFLPADVTLDHASGFIQDEIDLIPERVRASLGLRLEHNDYTGFEYSSSIRLSWTPSPNQTVWAALSRAIREPSRIDRELYAPGEPPHTLLAGGPNFVSERLLAYELGYRLRPTASLTLAANVFYHDYDDLRSVEPGPPAVIANGLEGRGEGLELEAIWQASEHWRWSTGYSSFDLDLSHQPGSTDNSQILQVGDSPRHQLHLRSRLDWGRDVELDVALRYVDALPRPRVPDYWAVDLRAAWKPTRSFCFELVGRNLTDPRHSEFGAGAARREIQRSIFGVATWTY